MHLLNKINLWGTLIHILYICTHPCTHTYPYMGTCTHMPTHTCLPTHAYIHMPTHMCIHTYVPTHTCIHTYVPTHTCIHTHAHAHTCTHPHTHTPTQVTKNRFDGDLGKLPLDWDKDSLTLSGHFKPHHRGESPPSEHDNYDNRTRLTRGNRWPANRSKSEGVCNIVYVGV